MNPIDIAKDLATRLEADPVAALQIKEYLTERRILELLGIAPEIEEVLTCNVGDATNEELIDEVNYRIRNKTISTDAFLP